MLCLLLAALICTENADGTWTCSSDGPDVGPDSGIVVDPSGSYVCTNCTAISSNECERIKHLVMSNCDVIISATVGTRSTALRLEDQIQSLINTFSSFTDCPYGFVEFMSNSAQMSVQLQRQGYSIQATTNYVIATQRAQDWKSTSNFAVVQIEPPINSYVNASGAISLSNQNLLTFHNALVGLWQSSYAVAQNSISQLTNALSTIQGVYNGTYRTEAAATDLYIQTRDTVTCAPCTLGSSAGGGSGAGSQTGCLDCYLNYLSSMDMRLESIDAALSALRPQLETYMTRVKSLVERNLDAPISSLTNIAHRIDDYLRTDQQQYLDTIQEALITITNSMPDSWNHYFSDYDLADKFHDHNDDEFDLSSAVAEVPEGGGEIWENLTWFSRIETLLASAAGFGASDPSDDVDTDIINDFDTAMSSVEGDSSGNAARDSISSLFDGLGQVFDALNIFGGVSEPTQIYLLNQAPIPLHSSSGTATVTVQVPDVPALFGFLRFVRYAFSAFYWIVALAGFVFVILRLYSTIVGMLRWASSFLGSVFAG